MSGSARLATRALLLRAAAVAGLLALSLLVTSAGAASPPVSAQGEIDHLLAYVEFSGCEFMRNGIWYSATEAGAHLREKLSIQNKARPVLTAEEFIDRVATRSAFTNIPYEQRCAGTTAGDVRTWLIAALLRYRQCRLTGDTCAPSIPQAAAPARPPPRAE